MSLECSDCERDVRSGHDPTCHWYDPAMADCICDPESHPRCPVHGLRGTDQEETPDAR